MIDEVTATMAARTIKMNALSDKANEIAEKVRELSVKLSALEDERHHLSEQNAGDRGILILAQESGPGVTGWVVRDGMIAEWVLLDGSRKPVEKVKA